MKIITSLPTLLFIVGGSLPMQQEELKDVERNVGTKITKLDQRDEIGTDRGGYAVHERVQGTQMECREGKAAQR